MCEAQPFVTSLITANNKATPSRNGNSDHFLQLAAIQTHAATDDEEEDFLWFSHKEKIFKHFSQIILKSECCETVAKGFRDRCDRNLLQSKALLF